MEHWRVKNSVHCKGKQPWIVLKHRHQRETTHTDTETLTKRKREKTRVPECEVYVTYQHLETGTEEKRRERDYGIHQPTQSTNPHTYKIVSPTCNNKHKVSFPLVLSWHFCWDFV